MSGTVLVVDDDPVILRLLELNFSIEGYEVLSAGDAVNGEELRRGRGLAAATAPDRVGVKRHRVLA